MASTITRVKPIRIANETADYFEGKALNRLVESVHRLLEIGRLSFDGEEVKICDVCADRLGTVIEEIESMALCYGLTVEEMTGQFLEMLNNGTLTVEDGVLRVNPYLKQG